MENIADLIQKLRIKTPNSTTCTLEELEKELMSGHVAADSVLDDTPLPSELLASYAFGSKISKIVTTFKESAPLIENKISKTRKIITEFKPLLNPNFYKMSSLNKLTNMAGPVLVKGLNPGQALYQLLIAKKELMPYLIGIRPLSERQ